MMQRMARLFTDYWIVLAFGLAAALLVVPPASAGMIATDEAAGLEERARVKALMERPELARELQKMGIAPREAAGRVDAMSDAEVLQLSGRLNAAIAGAQVSNEQLLLIIIIILLLVILL